MFFSIQGLFANPCPMTMLQRKKGLMDGKEVLMVFDSVRKVKNTGSK